MTFVSNPNYVEPEYDPNLKPSILGDKAGIWNPTAFGDLGGLLIRQILFLSSDGKGSYGQSMRKE